MPDEVLIIGGGVAGLACAVRLAQRGRRVRLIESRKVLGGRATSYTDPATGEPIDNCQHVVMGCCTNLLDFYQRLGVAHHIQWHDGYPFAFAPDQIDTLWIQDLPGSMLRFQGLSWRDKLALARAGWAMRCRAAPHDQSFGQWLEQHGQPRRLIERFWSPVVVSACNGYPHDVAADYAIKVFVDGLMRHPDAGRLGVSRVPLSDLYDPAGQLLQNTGGRIETATTAKALNFDGQRVTGVTLTDGRTLEADTLVSALPFHRLAKLCSDELIQADPRLQQLQGLRPSPIVGIHLTFQSPDRQPLLDLPFAALIGTPLHWVFDKGFDGRTHHLHGVVSAADDWMSMTTDQAVQQAVADLASRFPRVGRAKLIHRRVIKEPNATFACAPGVDAHRPDTDGPTRLLLAGDWCDVGWPATMEGAARSGYAAAGAILGEPLLVPDL